MIRIRHKHTFDDIISRGSITSVNFSKMTRWNNRIPSIVSGGAWHDYILKLFMPSRAYFLS